MNKSKKILSRPMVIAIAVELLLNFLAYYGTRVFMGDKYHYDLTNSLDNMIPVMPAFILIYYGSYLFWIVNYILGCRQDEVHGSFRCACNAAGRRYTGRQAAGGIDRADAGAAAAYWVRHERGFKNL